MSLGFYFDSTRCSGCRTCQVACKDRFDLQKAGPRTRRSDSFEAGAFPDATVNHICISCNHCDMPACVAHCPTGAMTKAEDGTVQHDSSTCIGCQTCVQACPYGAPQYLEEEKVVEKCDSCKALREAGMNPICVDACPLRALDFGEMDDLREKYGADLVSEVLCIASADKTTPNLLIKPKEAVLFTDFKEIAL